MRGRGRMSRCRFAAGRRSVALLALLLLGAWFAASLLMLPDLGQSTVAEWLSAPSGGARLKIAVIPNNVFDFVASIVEKNAGIQLTHVPFQGGKPGVTALLGGNVDIIFFGTGERANTRVIHRFRYFDNRKEISWA